ncbi:hypothetical protein [Corynebacterium glyciniphilum]|uniref:hypothetical protein n=1 Tax=Corynebacterium glyciniphilum TaxID=1404244 RepID=UPI002652AE93|nr:hypothetical protein [Corynebacterium glyciniphilum]MDN6706400.1 hypothetical protein [Corynebacterium glyciniphilum]
MNKHYDAARSNLAVASTKGTEKDMARLMAAQAEATLALVDAVNLTHQSMLDGLNAVADNLPGGDE